jgi:hypothetical protein
MKEELSDIVEELADKLGRWGADCRDIENPTDKDCGVTDPYQMCRLCFVEQIKCRIYDAVAFEQALQEDFWIRGG